MRQNRSLSDVLELRSRQVLMWYIVALEPDTASTLAGAMAEDLDQLPQSLFSRLEIIREEIFRSSFRLIITT